MTPNQSTPRLFEAVPVDKNNLPKEKVLAVSSKGHTLNGFLYKNDHEEVNCDSGKTIMLGVTHYLRPIPGIAITEEKLREVISQVYIEGWDKKSDYRTLNTYTNAKIKELFK